MKKWTYLRSSSARCKK